MECFRLQQSKLLTFLHILDNFIEILGIGFGHPIPIPIIGILVQFHSWKLHIDIWFSHPLVLLHQFHCLFFSLKLNFLNFFIFPLNTLLFFHTRHYSFVKLWSHFEVDVKIAWYPFSYVLLVLVLLQIFLCAALQGFCLGYFFILLLLLLWLFFFLEHPLKLVENFFITFIFVLIFICDLDEDSFGIISIAFLIFPASLGIIPKDKAIAGESKSNRLTFPIEYFFEIFESFFWNCPFLIHIRYQKLIWKIFKTLNNTYKY